MNPVSIGGHHHREAGANRNQVLAYHLADGIAYLQLGIDAGLNIDDFAPRFSFLEMSGSLELFKESALHRAARRMWARISETGLARRIQEVGSTGISAGR